ncbi:hypothetical protein O3M35_009795 [Rhynocoris fuscipes]|uniref:Uncharacterized protein n=1 Tax=Rhynocoris fuscipes TaxID=488301 RepID=A0AAW1D4Z9_9HEMI
MSGDVQPRKRKDKKRRKEDEELFGHFKNPTDEVLHIQKEAGLGGNICTKVIFFLLLAAIGITVGLILVEYHGSTDEDVIYNDEAPWNVAIKEWVEYLPVLPDILRGETDEHPQQHSFVEHSEEEQHEEEEEEVHQTDSGGEIDSGGESWLDIGQKWLSGIEIDLSFGGSSVVEEGEVEGEEVEEEEEKDEQKDERDDEVEDEASKEDETVKNESEEEEDDADEEEEEDDDADEGEEEEEGSVEAGVNDVDEEENDEEEDNDDDGNKEEEDDEEEEDKEEDDETLEEESLNKADDNEEEDMSLEDLGRELDEKEEEEDDNDVENDDTSLEDLGRELEDDAELPKDNSKEEEEELNSKEEDQNDDNDDENDSTVRNSNRTPDEDNRSEENDREMFDEIPETEEASSKEDLHPKKKDVSEEELFPEAVEALKKEASELIRAQAEAEEKASEPDNDPVDNDPAPSDKDDDSETEGMALKFGVGVALIVVAHMVLVKKWNSWVEANEAITTELKSSEQRKMEETSTEVPTFEAVRSTVSPLSSSVPVQEETVQTVYSAPVSEQPMPEQQPSIVQPVGPEEVSEEEEEEEEEEEVVELEGGDDEIDEDIGLSPKRYQELIAKYGQPTPESSDIEQSDDEPAEVREYSDGGENESVGEEESANELEESEPEEPEQTFIKVEKPVAAAKPSPVEVESEEEEEVEEEEEEEESEDEPPPPPPVKKPAPISKPTETRTRGGPKDTDEDYPYAEITNSDDWAIKEELDLAEEEFNFDRIQSAMDKFTLVLTKRPKSPRALYGLARAFDNQAEAKSSNKLLDKAIDTYMEVVKAPQVPDELFRRASERLINRLRFRGRHMNAVPVHRELINRFNNTVQYRNDLAITYLMVNRLEDAGAIFKNTLEKWPQNAMAQSHYGLVLKLQGKMKESIPHLLAGISTDDLSTRDARLYFHLGDALARTGAADQAMKVYLDLNIKGLYIMLID